MKRPIINALVTLMMVFLVANTSLAETMVVSQAHKFNTLQDKCTVCHGIATGLIPDKGASNNVCLVCHKTGSAYTSDKQFFKGDMANPFGTTVEDDSNKSYTHSSHEWSASDNNPAAGALPPVSPSMFTTASYLGNLTCNRCHAIHSNPTDPSFMPILRSSKTNDEMCLDCHRLRNTSNHVTGTHPINISYSSSVKTIAAPRTLASTPMNSNPANLTSDLNQKLANGKSIGTLGVVLCTTCHGVHFTDSSSKTFDSRSTSIRAALIPSKGYLLRTDYRYANYTSVNSPNICTNCHTNKFTHNGGGQNVKCTDCHSAHVDYDFKALTPQDRIPNVFMIKRYMNWSSPTGWRDNKKLPKKLVAQYQYSTLQTYFQYTGSQRQYMRTDGKGVCQSCHAVPSAGLNANGKTYPGEHGIGNQNATANDCSSCHNHYTPAPQGSFAASCTNCHGQPPQGTTAAPSAPGYTGNDGISAHARHSAKGSNYAFTCKECHYSGAPPALHITTPGTYQDVFKPGYTNGILASQQGATPKYNNATGTCSTNYCHSNGAPRGLAFKMYTSPAWFGAKITTCDKCHEASPTTNVHATHVTTSDHLAFSCETCHSATVSGSNTIKDKIKHVDNIKEIVFNYASLPFVISGTYDGATGTCATIYCHSDGSGSNYQTPKWTDPASGACGTSCHDTSTRASGAHQAHLSVDKLYGPGLNQFLKEAACTPCHFDHTTNHINGKFDIPNQAVNCAVLCHKNKIGADANWLTGRAGITCESCHTGLLSVVNGFAATDKSLSVTKGHGMLASSTAVAMNYACTVCHNPNAPHINPPVRNGRLFANYSGLLNTACTFCHNDPLKVTTLSKQNLPSHVLDKNASPTASSCNTCHDLHGTSNKYMIRALINGQVVSFKNTTGLVSTTLVNGKYTGLCQVCHTLTNHYTNSAPELFHQLNTNCLTCHKHTDKLNGLPVEAGHYAFMPSGGGCGGCHGYPPVQSMANIGVQGNYTGAMLENYSGGGGAHNVAGHIALTAKPIDTWAGCITCHYGTQSDPNHSLPPRDKSKPSNINVTVDPKYKFNTTLPITYTGNRVDPPLRNSTGTCSNVSCHFQPTPKWSTVR